MRNIGQLESEAAARRFSDFLVVEKIPHQIEQGGEGRWDIWVHSDDDLSTAGQFLAAFRTNPNDPQFASAEKASTVRTEYEREQKEFQKRVKTRGQLFRRFVLYQMGPLTILLIAICVYVAIKSRLGKNAEPLNPLVFSEYFIFNIWNRLGGSLEIRSGEFWRLITPIFIHYGPLHIFFNMLWLRDLGGMIETVEGWKRLLLLILVSAAVSNWAEYFISGVPRFGGMSGVIYALLGYVWMKGKYEPASGLYLHKDTVTMMLIWLVVCFTGAIGHIANYAHLFGLLVGVVWGFLATRRV